MTTKEAIQAMLDGKKVRVCGWDTNFYVYISSDGYIRDNLEHLYNFENTLGWEIYEEPKPKETVTIEKWLCCAKDDMYYVFEASLSQIEYASHNKIKLLGTYEVTL